MRLSVLLVLRRSVAGAVRVGLVMATSAATSARTSGRVVLVVSRTGATRSRRMPRRRIRRGRTPLGRRRCRRWRRNMVLQWWPMLLVLVRMLMRMLMGRTGRVRLVMPRRMLASPSVTTTTTTRSCSTDAVGTRPKDVGRRCTLLMVICLLVHKVVGATTACTRSRSGSTTSRTHHPRRWSLRRRWTDPRSPLLLMLMLQMLLLLLWMRRRNRTAMLLRGPPRTDSSNRWSTPLLLLLRRRDGLGLLERDRLGIVHRRLLLLLLTTLLRIRRGRSGGGISRSALPPLPLLARPRRAVARSAQSRGRGKGLVLIPRVGPPMLVLHLLILTLLIHRIRMRLSLIQRILIRIRLLLWLLLLAV